MDDAFELALLLLDPTSIDHAQLKRLESVSASAVEIHEKLKITLRSREESARTRLARRAALREEYFRTRKSSPEIRAAIAMESVDAKPDQPDRAALNQMRSAIKAWTNREKILKDVHIRLAREAHEAVERAARATRKRIVSLMERGDFEAASLLRDTADGIYLKAEFEQDVVTVRKRLGEEHLAETARLERKRLAQVAINNVRALITLLTSCSVNPKRDSQPLLTEDDYRLCSSWAGIRANLTASSNREHLEQQVGDYDSARLMSARQAELVACEYYRALGHKVTDVSLTQLSSGNDGRWKECDLLVDGRAVDVKNARRAYGSYKTYVEHCVPRFKQDRGTKDDVSILGVLSEYKSTTDIAAGMGDTIILGEVKVSDIEQLDAWVRRRFGGLINFKGFWTAGFQPGWVFEYSEEFYRERVAALNTVDEVLERFCQFAPELETHPKWILPFCSIERVIERAVLSRAQRSILSDLQDLRAHVGLTRPTLFVYVLARILEAIASPATEDDAIQTLKGIILSRDSVELDSARPLGLADPQGYVASLFDVFTIVFDEIRRQQIQFTAFKLQHPSILLGMTGSGLRMTVLAYCGGWKMSQTKVKCGRTPLYLGRHETCPSCGHLVCDNCGFCAAGCELSDSRQKSLAQREAEVRSTRARRYGKDDD